MICGERGVLPKSQYFFFSPSEQFLKYNYGVVNCGHFYCHFGYRREREGNAYPLFICHDYFDFYVPQKIYPNQYHPIVLQTMFRNVRSYLVSLVVFLWKFVL